MYNSKLNVITDIENVNQLSIRNFYKCIKNDNLTDFQSAFAQIKDFIYSDKKNKNFVLYALENDSTHILDYLFNFKNGNKDSSELLEYITNYVSKKNQTWESPFNFLGQILHSNNEITLFNFFKYIPVDLTHTLFEAQNLQNLHIALTRLNSDNWPLFFHYYENHFDNTLLMSHVNSQSLLGTIASLDNIAHLPFISKFPTQAFFEKNEDGFTPFLTASRFCRKEIVEIFLKYSDFYSKTNFDNDCISISCFNKKTDTFEYLFNHNLNISTPIKHDGYSPLHISICEDFQDKALLILPSSTEDISSSLVEQSKHLKQSSSRDFLVNLIEKSTTFNLNKLQTKEHYARNFWQNVFYHCNFDFIQNLLKDEKLLTSFLLLKNFPEESHYLFHTTISGKKDMGLKINFLLNYFQVLHAEDSESFFQPTIINNELFYQNLKSNEIKPNKSFCFASSLSSLPINQLKNILSTTQISKNLSPYDFLLIYSIGLQKKSLSLLKLIKKDFLFKFPNIKSLHNSLPNISDFVENNLIIAQDKENNILEDIRFKNKIKEIISSFDRPPNNLLSKIAFNVLNNDSVNKVEELQSVLNIFSQNKVLQNSFTNSIICLLLQKDNLSDDLISHFIKNRSNISKVCFAKLVNLEKIENVKDKKQINISVDFADKSESSALSKIILIDNEDSAIYDNIHTYQTLKPNPLFDMFISHQMDNIQLKHYPEHILNSYNLRVWGILFSIIDSNNENSMDLLTPLLKVTDFHIDTLNSSQKNLSINNFKRLYRHFDLDSEFWTKFISYYSNSTSLVHKGLTHLFHLKYIAFSDNEKICPNKELVNKSFAFLEINNMLTDKHLLNMFNSVLSGKHNNVDFLLTLDKYFYLLNDKSKKNVLEICLNNEQFSYLEYLLSDNPDLIHSLKLESIFTSPSFLQKIDRIKISSFTEQTVDEFASMLSFIKQNSSKFSTEQLSSFLKSMSDWTISDTNKHIHNLISNMLIGSIGKDISRCDDESLLQICSHNFKSLGDNQSMDSIFEHSYFYAEQHKHFNDFLTLIFNAKDDVFLNDVNALLSLDENKDKLSFDNLSIIREYHLNQKINDNHLLSLGLNKQDKKKKPMRAKI